MINDIQKDFVVMGIQPWDIQIGSNCRNIAIELAKKHRVLYVNVPVDRISLFRNRHDPRIRNRRSIIRSGKTSMEQVQDNLWVLTPSIIIESINWIRIEALFDSFNKHNVKQFARSIREALEKLGMNSPLLFNDQHMFLGQNMKDLIGASKYIYYIRDNLVKNPYWQRHGCRLEPRLIQQADVVVTNSDYYRDYALQYNPKAYMIGQGCDTSIYDDRNQIIPVAPEMNAIEKPVIGYTGFLSHRRLDINLLLQVFHNQPKWNLVLVGPEDDVFKKSPLHQYPNVHFLGQREPENLPQYVKAFDVAINPQILNEATIGNYPRKIDEYLAMGKPTVAIRTRAMEYFSSYLYLAGTAEEFTAAIQAALDEKPGKEVLRRAEFSGSHTWKRSIDLMFEALNT